MDKSLFEKYILSINIVNGFHRSIYQVPFHMALTLALIRLGLSVSEALSLVFIFIAAIASCFNFVLEMAGGWLSHKLGVLGSFRLLPIGLLIRAFEVILMIASFFMPTPFLIITFAFLAVIVGQISYCIISGIYEDAYGQTAAYLSPEDAGNKIIAGIEFKIRYVFYISRIFVASIATAMVVTGFYFYDVGILYKLSIAFPFIIGVMMCLFSSYVAWDWYQRAKSFIKEDDQSQPEKNYWKEQAKIFFMKGDWLLSFILGFHTMIIFWVINLAPMTSDGILDSYAAGEKSWASLGEIVFLAFIIPCLFLIGQYVFDKAFGKTDAKREQILRRLDTPLGYVFFVGVCALAIPLTAIPMPAPVQYSLLAVMIMLHSALLIWTRWVRIPLVEEAEADSPKYFSSNRSFYFSLIAGMLETSVCLCAFLEIGAKSIFGESSLAALVILINIACAVCMFLWVLQRRAFNNRRSVEKSTV